MLLVAASRGRPWRCGRHSAQLSGQIRSLTGQQPARGQGASRQSSAWRHRPRRVGQQRVSASTRGMRRADQLPARRRPTSARSAPSADVASVDISSPSVLGVLTDWASWGPPARMAALPACRCLVVLRGAVTPTPAASWSPWSRGPCGGGRGPLRPHGRSPFGRAPVQSPRPLAPGRSGCAGQAAPRLPQHHRPGGRDEHDPGDGSAKSAGAASPPWSTRIGQRVRGQRR